jgi:hypothetical protein
MNPKQIRSFNDEEGEQQSEGQESEGNSNNTIFHQTNNESCIVHDLSEDD